MRWVLTGLSALVLAGLGLLWLSGGFEALARFAAGQQRLFQNEMAGSLRALRGGEAGAIWALMGLSFAYGFFHAAGPGHGKVLIGGYGLGRNVAALRLSAIGLLSSLGQAVTAILLVYSGVWLLNLTRQTMVGVADDIMAPVSYGAIALIGLWLAMRGLRKLTRGGRDEAHDHDHHYTHGEEGTCSSCGHRHGPSLEEVENVTSLKDALLLIGGIAIRPCTGALFVLIITWQMGIGWIGIAAAFAMALGTAGVTIGVGLAAVGLRGGMLAGFAGSALMARVVPVIELLAGAVIVVIAVGLLMRAL